MCSYEYDKYDCPRCGYYKGNSIIGDLNSIKYNNRCHTCIYLEKICKSILERSYVMIGTEKSYTDKVCRLIKEELSRQLEERMILEHIKQT